MNIEDLLNEEERAIVEEAFQATVEIARYRRDGTPVTRRRVEALYRQLAAAVRARDVTGLLAYVRQIAHERSAAGFELSDVRRRSPPSRTRSGTAPWPGSQPTTSPSEAGSSARRSRTAAIRCRTNSTPPPARPGALPRSDAVLQGHGVGPRLAAEEMVFAA
jgi:hypothetical protein